MSSCEIRLPLMFIITKVIHSEGEVVVEYISRRESKLCAVCGDEIQIHLVSQICTFFREIIHRIYYGPAAPIKFSIGNQIRVG